MTLLQFEFSKVGEYWKLFASGFNFRRHIGRIESLENVEEFIITRSAFIAQKTLFGYVKTRMGTKYPEMFRDDIIIRSVNIAKMHAYAACLSDFCVWAVPVDEAEALTRDEFTESPAAIVDWAPISDELKKYDIEYVENSVKFAWANIRRQFEKRLDRDALAARTAGLATGGAAE